MTTEDQDAEVGRLVRERRDLRAHHQALIAKSQKLSKLLVSIGKALNIGQPGSMHPSPTFNIDQDGNVKVSDEYRPQEIITGKFPTTAEIQELLQETKHVAKQVADLDTQLKAFGV